MAFSTRSQAINRWFVHCFRYSFGVTAALMLFAMMWLTFFDVVGRTFFSSPIPGGFEITELMLAGLIFLALPLVTVENAHVEVDLLDHWVPKRLKKIQNILIRLINLSALFVLSWMLFKLTLRLYGYEDATATLEIPLFWLTALMTLTCFLSAISLLLSPLKVAVGNAPTDNEY